MTYQDTVSQHLPDPIRQPEFYEHVPAKRLLAWVIDTGLIMILVLLIMPFTFFLGFLFFPLMYVVIGFAYRVVTLTGTSATWGMRIAAIEIRQADGQRLDLSGAFLHTAGYSLSVSIPILQVISIVLMLTTSMGQGLTDHVLGTVALNRRR